MRGKSVMPSVSRRECGVVFASARDESPHNADSPLGMPGMVHESAESQLRGGVLSL